MGIEPNSAVAQKALQQMQEVLIGKYESLFEQIPDDYFDLIICNDVIEHMESHDFFLALVAIRFAWCRQAHKNS